MTRDPTPSQRPPARGFLALVLAVTLAGCMTGPSAEEIEAARKTIDCDRDGARIVIRFEEGEARVLMPDGTRLILYQVSVPSGVRYLNGEMELRGKGLELQLVHNGVAGMLTCKPYEIPKKGS